MLSFTIFSQSVRFLLNTRTQPDTQTYFCLNPNLAKVINFSGDENSIFANIIKSADFGKVFIVKISEKYSGMTKKRIFEK